MAEIKPYRIALFALVLVFLVSVAHYFEQNISFLLNPAALYALVSGQWLIVAIWIVVFSSFSLFLVFPRKRGEYRKYKGAYVAYIIALFTEMFGFPLTLYLLSGFLPHGPAVSAGTPAVAFSFDFLGVGYDLLMTSLIAGMVSIAGGVLIILGWKQIYNTESLVTGGIYRYSRHPQYLGMSMVIIAWMFAWPTIPTTIMGAILVVVYYRLGKTEERELEKEFGKPYAEYRDRTPMYA
jgi:protein-S-isoprenylcysteine O-methyltransferase Ste14